ncbi:MAG: CotH kinase family protein [Bacteroidia bacterium]|nr:CotH kinase family protein [Bacteroidia bacterium]
MRRILPFLLVMTLFSGFLLKAQPAFYLQDSIREIRINFAITNWDHVLDSLYILGDEQRLIADLVVDGTLIPGVGVRYKGYSSVSTNRDKNPFNIKLDYSVAGQKYRGIDKIKLSNVIQDPSFIREVLSYEIARKYMPASGANFANVYVNDTLIGLYTNVESVDKQFIEQHFPSKNNPLFKGNPEVLDFSGGNSNLDNSPGTDPADYYPYYTLESTYGWDELYHLIDTLNNHPDQVHKVLNVDRTLWMHAFNYALINFDSYVGYAQNFYIYRDDFRRFNPIVWDLNMSFASFRFTDASDYWDGFDLNEAKIIDPLSHHNSFSIIPRPLMRNLFANDTYRRMYMAHLRTIMEENFANQEYYLRGAYLQNLIDSDVAADSNKFYSYADFHTNLDTTVTDLIDYPGLRDLMEGRLAYLNAYPGFRAGPEISSVTPSPATVALGDELGILANISNATEVWLNYRFSSGDLFTQIAMFDDGNHNDGAASDGTWGISIPEIGSKVEYYLYAQNDSAGKFSPERAEYEFYSLTAALYPQNLVINECMSANTHRFADQDGEYDDWIEIYNTTPYEISIQGLYLSDDPANPTKWALPNGQISGNEYLIVWADGQTSQEGLHASFELDPAGGMLLLSSSDSTVIDSVEFGYQYPVTSYGRYPNGTGAFQEMLPTFKKENSLAASPALEDQFFVYPNPAQDQVNVIARVERPLEIEIMDITGKRLAAPLAITDEGLITLSTLGLRNGLYLIRLRGTDFVETRKIVINP